jgi:hypothetical protein
MRTFKELKEEIRGCSQYNTRDISRLKALSILLEESLKDKENALHESEIIFRNASKLLFKYKNIYIATKSTAILDMSKDFEFYTNKKVINKEILLERLNYIKDDLSLSNVLKFMKNETYYEYITYKDLINAVNSIKENNAI